MKVVAAGDREVSQGTRRPAPPASKGQRRWREQSYHSRCSCRHRRLWPYRAGSGCSPRPGAGSHVFFAWQLFLSASRPPWMESRTAGYPWSYPATKLSDHTGRNAPEWWTESNRNAGRIPAGTVDAFPSESWPDSAGIRTYPLIPFSALEIIRYDLSNGLSLDGSCSSG